MTKLKTIFLADLNHTQSGIQALTFPLGTAYVAAYSQKILGQSFEFKLFKFFHNPEQILQVKNAVRMYQNHPEGMSRVLYGQSLKKMYREFEVTKSPTSLLVESA